MLKKLLLLLFLGSLIGWVTSCAWKAPLQEINVPGLTCTFRQNN